jgi:hypothetical protein
MGNKQRDNNCENDEGNPAPDLALVLDDCVDQLLLDRVPPRVCLAQYPERVVDLAPLLDMAERLSHLPDVRPSEAFKKRTRQHIQNLQGPPRSYTFEQVTGPLHTRWMTTVYGIVILIGLLAASGATVFASTQILPGTPFYPVKRHIESVQIVLANDSSSRANVHLMLAERRLDEVNKLVMGGQVALAEETVSEYSAHISSVLVDLESDHGESKLGSIKYFGEQLVRTRHELSEQEAHAREPVREPLHHALTVTERMIDRVSKLVGVSPEGLSH